MRGLESFGSTLTIVPDWNNQEGVLGAYVNDQRWLIMGADVDTNNNIRLLTPRTIAISSNNAGTALTIKQDTNNIALDIDSTNTATPAVRVSVNSLTTSSGISVTSSSTDTSNRALVFIDQQAVTATKAIPLELKQISAAPYINFRETGTATPGSVGIFNFTGKATLASFAGFVTSFATTWHGALLFNSPDGLLRIPCAKSPS